MQTTSNATLFQTSHSEALGAYRSRKAVHTSGLVSASSSSSSSSQSTSARYGYPIHLHPNFATAVIANPDDLAVEGSGADGGRYRILSLAVHDGWVWTSESGGVVRQVDAESGKTAALYKGAKAPVPSFDFLTTDAGEKLLVTGSWDKAVRVYRIATGEGKVMSSVSPVVTVDNAMADFIKCVHIFSEAGTTYIATAGSDKSIMLFDATPLTSQPITSSTTLRCVHQAKPHTRPINALTSLVALDGTTRLYSGDSMGRVLESTVVDSRLTTQREIKGFGTAVYDLVAGFARVEVETSSAAADAFASEVKEDDEGSRFQLIGELFGASGDKTVKGYRLSSPTTPYVTLPHTDYVKAVLPLAFHLPDSRAIVTGGSDEHLRLFTSPPASLSDEEVHTVEAHWHEITSLSLWSRPATPSPPSDLPPSQVEEAWVVSAGLDGSIRRFRLDDVPKLPKPELVRPTPDHPQQQEAKWDQYSLPPTSKGQVGQDAVVGGVKMTAEEEAELAELMGSDDE